MGRRRISYYQVTCDYPDHAPTQLPAGAGYRVFNGGDLVICDNCWEDKLVVEVLLKMLNIGVLHTQVGQEK